MSLSKKQSIWVDYKLKENCAIQISCVESLWNKSSFQPKIYTPAVNCLSFCFFLCLHLSDVSCPALPDLCAEAISAAERSERGFHWGDQLLQSNPHGHQLPTGTTSCAPSGRAIVIRTESSSVTGCKKFLFWKYPFCSISAIVFPKVGIQIVNISHNNSSTEA